MAKKEYQIIVAQYQEQQEVQERFFEVYDTAKNAIGYVRELLNNERKQGYTIQTADNTRNKPERA